MGHAAGNAADGREAVLCHHLAFELLFLSQLAQHLAEALGQLSDLVAPGGYRAMQALDRLLADLLHAFRQPGQGLYQVAAPDPAKGNDHQQQREHDQQAAAEDFHQAMLYGEPRASNDQGTNGRVLAKQRGMDHLPVIEVEENRAGVSGRESLRQSLSLSGLGQRFGQWKPLRMVADEDALLFIQNEPERGIFLLALPGRSRALERGVGCPDVIVQQGVGQDGRQGKGFGHQGASLVGLQVDAGLYADDDGYEQKGQQRGHYQAERDAKSEALPALHQVLFPLVSATLLAMPAMES